VLCLPPCSLLGFPIQFIGLVVTPYLALRYFVNKEAEPLEDAEVGDQASPCGAGGGVGVRAGARRFWSLEIEPS
jgi:hypothetical protein